MDSMTSDTRTYYFGKNKKKVEVANGGYLPPDRIKHYEDVFGPLYSMRYRGHMILCE